MLDRLRQRVRQLKREVYALYLVVRDPRTPWYARLFAGMVVAYAFSPIDLIPDFIPVLGYLDDVILVPLGIWLALKMIPTAVMADSRLVADEVMAAGKPVNWGAAVVIVAVWLLLALLVAIMVARFVRGGLISGNGILSLVLIYSIGIRENADHGGWGGGCQNGRGWGESHAHRRGKE